MRPIRRLVIAGLLMISASGCGGEDSPGFVNSTEPPLATESPLIVEHTTPKPGATALPLSLPPGDYYKPSGWTGGDVNCSDFDTKAHAQSFFKGTGGSTSRDDYGLDGDHDGSACETLP